VIARVLTKDQLRVGNLGLPDLDSLYCQVSTLLIRQEVERGVSKGYKIESAPSSHQTLAQLQFRAANVL
jgi:hypothetical protein